jgi:hypothetical protein
MDLTGVLRGAEKLGVLRDREGLEGTPCTVLVSRMLHFLCQECSISDLCFCAGAHKFEQQADVREIRFNLGRLGHACIAQQLVSLAYTLVEA